MMINNINFLQAHRTLMDVNTNNIANVNTEDFNSTDIRLDIFFSQEKRNKTILDILKGLK